jgi:hypothetical protein
MENRPYDRSQRQPRFVTTLSPNHIITNVFYSANASAVMETLTYIKPGSIIRLQHIRTGKHLHSHDVRPPVSDVDFQNEVSGYGFQGFDGDANDNWILELDESGELFPSFRSFLLLGVPGMGADGLCRRRWTSWEGW